MNYFKPITPEQMVERQLLKARIDLLEAHRMLEMWQAQVSCHEKTIARLQKYDTLVSKGEANV